MKVVHAQPDKYRLARYWYIQRDALYARELADNLQLLVLFSYCQYKKVQLHLKVKSLIHRIFGHTIVHTA